MDTNQIEKTLDNLYDITQRIDERLRRVEAVERGEIPPDNLPIISNDPTELEIANGKELHQWTFPAGVIDMEDRLPLMECSVCKVKLSDCGATEDSWYCH